MNWPLEGEQPLDLDEIQGHILVGFGSAPQALGAYTAADRLAAARTVGRWAGRVTTSRALLGRKGERALDVVGRIRAGPWVAMAVSHRLLEAGGHPVQFDGDWFENSSMADVGGLHDPAPADGRRRGSDWVAGAPTRPIDVLVVVAAGTAGAAEEIIGWFTDDAREWLEGDPFVEQLHPMKGAKEHFGFRDGVSQPAILGTHDDGMLFEPDRPPDGGKAPKTAAAQDLVWPGEFIFGYRGTGADPRVPGDEVRPADDAAAEFARNGSLLVYRRLAQDVRVFKSFCARKAAEHGAEYEGLTASTVEQLIVGRRPDGLPLAAHEGADRSDPLVTNGFTFLHDDMDQVCPLSAHIRKVNPRSGTKDRRLRRILRRGAPFGTRYEDDEAAPPERGRGLAFLAYMTSTEHQFGMLAKDWMSDPQNPGGRGGHDLLVGQVRPGETRWFDLRRDRPGVEINAGTETWVHMTGGAFLFAPSLSALRSLAPELGEREGVHAMAGPEPEDLEKAIRQYAIYEHPDEYAEGYVMRKWLVTGDEVLPGDGKRAATLDEARALLPEGVKKVAGQDPNEPQIIEVWM